jgi:RNA 2',3'-cyclic 3'-phosphodiesterase
LARLQRFFLALQPDASARAALAAVPVPTAARRVDPADLHLTLAFLGTLQPATEAKALEAARVAIAAVGTGGAVLRVQLATVEHWAGARSLCAVARGGDEPVAALAARLAAELLTRGFPAAERPFRAHVTLARHLPSSLPSAAGAVPLSLDVSWEASEVVLMASRQGMRPRYTTLASLPLGVPGPVSVQEQ